MHKGETRVQGEVKEEVMDLDCTFYFWKRKLASFVAGVSATGIVYAIVATATNNTPLMCLAYGLLVGIFVGTSTNVLMSESFCSDNTWLDCKSAQTLTF